MVREWLIGLEICKETLRVYWDKLWPVFEPEEEERQKMHYGNKALWDQLWKSNTDIDICNRRVIHNNFNKAKWGEDKINAR